MIKVWYNPRTARTLYNKKDAVGVKHDTENSKELHTLVQFYGIRGISFVKK